ncbi:MAG: 4-alpha-glucanotransferase [Bacteroidaceae bacterium]|nr:4-alpha-glucanotransferase [Bacteroidaceae bacterium]
MKACFEIHYRTQWGEHLELQLRQTAEDGKTTQRTTALDTIDGEVWRTELTLPNAVGRLHYSYRVMEGRECKREEWSLTPHTLVVAAGTTRIAATDQWRVLPDDAYRYTSSFTEAFAAHPVTTMPTPEGKKQLVIHLFAPEVPADQTLAVLGNQEGLGNWQSGREVRLAHIGLNEWAFALNLDSVQGAVEYKFLTLDAATGEQRLWEMRDNRILVLPAVEQGMTHYLQDPPAYFPVTPWRGAGCVIPVFSLRTEHTYGVGDFGALRKMIDWVALTGQRVLQILPINDTTITNRWTDSYPYNSISIYAFHPMYVDLSQLPVLKDASLARHYEELRVELNALSQVDYERVNEAKRAYLRLLFKQEWPRTLGTKNYKEFYQQNQDWLVPYAAFSYLRDTYGTPDFRQWKTLSEYDADSVALLCKKGRKSAGEINFYCYVQYLLHVQLSAASQYARSRGVVIKGDIPIGISRNSVEAWVEPHYFNMNGQAGAPPDPFSANGQNWGFPTYNWDAMLCDGCQWWVRRFRKMAEYFDAYRIDHVLGFFRIWEIPLHSVHGLLGQFSPALPMTVEEIESYGLPWRESDYTTPYIDDHILLDIFGDQTAEVRRRYIETCGNGRYCLRSDYDTQRKVEAAFAADNATPRADQPRMSEAVRDGLYALLSNVLFVRDRKNAYTYHPRIAAMDDYVFQQLSYSHKEAFRRLHDDYYYRRHNQFWYAEAMKKLPVLAQATRMLVCAEDLGMVPACVPWVMEELKVLTLEIQSMPKNPSYAFGHLWENPYRSVATISTHDMATLRGWWDEDREIARQFYNDALYLDGAAPHPMPGWLAEQVIVRHLECPSMLCLLSLQDWLSMDEQRRYPDPAAERINVPANPRHYWRYRMHVTVEQLLADTEFNDKLASLIKKYRR